MLKKIKLHGILGEKFGSDFELDVESVAEAVRALCILVQGFEAFMANAHLQGVQFAIYLDDRNIDEKELCFATESSIIRISPVIDGAKSGGIFQIVIGVVMIAAAFYTGGASLAAWGAMQAAMAGAGAAMLLGGISQMMMPSAITTMDQNQDGNKPNYGFGGAVTTVAQGLPVPVLYGQREIGGFIISAKQESKDLDLGFNIEDSPWYKP